MQLTGILLTICCLTATAKVTSQITLKVNNVPLKEVFNQIHKQSGFDIFYNGELLRKAGNVTIEVNNVTLQEALNACLAGKSLTYKINEKTIVISAIQPTASAGGSLSNLAPPPPIDIHGHVTDSLGNPLVGASVTVKGTRTGTTTDANGNFDLKVVSDNVILIISFTGFETRQIALSSNPGLKSGADISGNPFSLTLKRSISPLDQVQVIAYGTTTQRLSTGDVTTVKAVDIEKAPVSNVLAAIEGRVPGLLITQNSGMPGGRFTVEIRGRNSLSQGNDPFYVIDGVPYNSHLIDNLNPAGGNPLNFINPSDIESVDILKDADATAIYGSRAANGAILITTKKGKAGKTRLDVNVYEGVGKAPQKIHWLNTPQYLEMRREAFKNDGVIPSADPNDPAYAPDLLVWDTTRYTDWQKFIIGGYAQYTNIQANLSGGNTNLQYVLGGAYNFESTVFPMQGAVPHSSIHFNITNTSADQKFKLMFTGNYNIDNSHLPAMDLSSFVSAPPDAPPLYDKDGNLNLSVATWGNIQNPLAFTYKKYKARTNNLVANAVLSYQLLTNLDIKSSIGYTDMLSNEFSTNSIASQDPAFSPKGSAELTNNSIRSWIIEPQATYNITFGLNRIDALLGATFQQNTLDGKHLVASGYTSDALLENILAAPFLTAYNVTYAVYKYNALFGRLSYNFGDEWLLNLTWRRDGSSRFGPDRQFHDFVSMGAAWIFSKENIVQRALPFLSFGKLRGSYGTTGNDQIGDYQYYDLFQTTPYSYQSTTGLTPVGISNPDLAWEETKKLEGGLELGFIKDRILFQANYYRNRSSNQLVSSNLPAVTGFGTVSINLPATVQNTGWEIMLNSVNVKSKNFGWSSSFNLTMARNKLVDYPGLQGSPNQDVFFIGQPLGTSKVFHFIGVDPRTGVYEFSDSKRNPTFNPSFLTDRTVFLNTTPKYYFGLLNSLNFKGWQLDIFFHFRKQFGGNYLQEFPYPPGVFGSSRPTYALNRWRKPGDNAPVERYTQNFSSNVVTAYKNYASSSDYEFVDASFIRLANLSLSFQFPSLLTRKLHLQNARIFFHGQNLLTITKYKGVDPESQGSTALPPLRVFTGGINLTL